MSAHIASRLIIDDGAQTLHKIVVNQRTIEEDLWLGKK